MAPDLICDFISNRRVSQSPNLRSNQDQGLTLSSLTCSAVPCLPTPMLTLDTDMYLGIAPLLEISAKYYIPVTADLEADYTGNKLNPWKAEDGTNLEFSS